MSPDSTAQRILVIANRTCPCPELRDLITAEEIIISSWPEGDSNWLEKDIVREVRARFDVPVHHLVALYGLEMSDAGVA